jgi:tetratricopeptide (TPR) repeat protein
MCVRAVAGGEDLDDVIPGFSGHKVALVARDVIEVLQAGDLKRSAPPGGDWLRTIAAESRFAEAARLWQLRKESEAKTATTHGQEILEGVAASSDRSPVLFYEDIYFEAAQSLLRRSDRRALERHNQRVADLLRDPKAPNLMMALRDLAVVHLKLGDYPEGLAMLAALLRHDSSDPWTFNALALDLPRLGFAAEGRLAAERGLELVHQYDDPDQLAKQLTELLREVSRGEDRSDAPKDATADLRDALRTPFDVKGPGSSRELALRRKPLTGRGDAHSWN